MKNRVMEIGFIVLCVALIIGSVYVKKHPAVKAPTTIYLQNENLSAYVNIDTDAHKTLDISDNLSKEEIQTLVDYLYENSKCKDVCDFTDIADELYNWQQANNCSVTGILAILQTEGIFNSSLFYKYWNTGFTTLPNVSAKAIGDTKFADCTDLYKSPSEALLEGINNIYSLYIRGSYNQNTFYKICYTLSDGSVYDALNRDEAITQTALITHSYCPYWLDENIAMSLDTASNTTNSCWCNTCADAKKQLIKIAKGEK